MMGYVIIVSKTGMFSAAEQQIIPLLSSSAKERVVRSNNGNWIDYRASQLNNIFADMLAGTQNVDMERRMKLAKLSFPEQKCLAIIRPVYYKEPAYYKSRLIPDMQAIFGKTAFSVVKNDLVLLLTAADGGTITPEQRAALEQYTQGHRLIVGISNCFQANNQLSLHYNMLLQTLQLAKQMRSDQKLFFFLGLRVLRAARSGRGQKPAVLHPASRARHAHPLRPRKKRRALPDAARIHQMRL